jgi:hypothetical protein
MLSDALEDALEDALAVARQGVNANPTMEERLQLHEDILALTNIQSRGVIASVSRGQSRISARSPQWIQQIKTLAAQMDMQMDVLRGQRGAPFKAVHEVRHVLEQVDHALAAAIIFDPWPGRR